MWYVYKIMFEDGRFYIGYRGTKKSIEQDFLVKYFSSSKIVKRLIEEKLPYTGQIVSLFEDQISAYDFEQNLIKYHIDNPYILNKACYYKRKGYGIITDASRKKIGEKSKEKWADPIFKEKMIQKHKARWTNEKKKAYSEYMKSAWTEERKNSHSRKLTGKKRIQPSPLKGIPFSEQHRKNISKGSKGKPKSEAHKLNVSKSRRGKKYPNSRPGQHLGYKWYHNPETNIKRFISSELPIPEGYIIGKGPNRQKKAKIYSKLL